MHRYLLIFSLFISFYLTHTDYRADPDEWVLKI